MKKVLIVEDDLVISLVLERMVKVLGYQIIAKTCFAEEAIEISRKLCPEIIFMDIRLKGEMDGVEATRIINSRQPEIDIFYVTGNTDNLYKERVDRTKFVRLIHKPFTMQDLSTSLGMIA